ncbi:hypothetical protein [Aeromonas caviae]|uniref:hypothetical protein n=1 Tax=Aeromonas caviae TaxID=648 RepID=UPI002B460066|nr:hypothetical protein [Aeromonas caviae]
MNNGRFIIGFSIYVVLQAFSVGAIADNKLWVTTDRTNRYTCPSTECGVAGRLMFREGVDAIEKKGEWVRITKAYSASCAGGISEYVKEGNKSCTSANGIKDGLFSEWVQSKDLSKTRPEDPSEGANGYDVLVKGSDDYLIYRTQFAKAARQLIIDGTCTEADFQDTGGWMASTNRGPSMYFTYCGGMTLSNKVYLDTKSGKISR